MAEQKKKRFQWIWCVLALLAAVDLVGFFGSSYLLGRAVQGLSHDSAMQFAHIQAVKMTILCIALYASVPLVIRSLSGAMPKASLKSWGLALLLTALAFFCAALCMAGSSWNPEGTSSGLGFPVLELFLIYHILTFDRQGGRGSMTE